MLDDVSGDWGAGRTTRIHHKPANSPDKTLALVRQYAAHSSQQVGGTCLHLLLYTIPIT